MANLCMNLETIQSMWEKDSLIDKDNLHDESLKIPSLHAKYHEMFVTFMTKKTIGDLRYRGHINFTLNNI